MATVMERDYRLRWMDFDKWGRVQPFALFDLCQDVATLHAEDMGIGRDDMVARGVFWAVVRQKLEIVSAPARFQTVTLRTWPHSPSRVSFQRDFLISDEAGSTLAKATSEWVLVNLETRKFASLTDFYQPPDDLPADRAFERKPRKVKDFPEGNRPVATFVPGYSDIDVNGHVNNAKYADFAMDALAPGPGTALKSIQLDYRHEALPGSPLSVHTLVEDDQVRMKGLLENGTVSFACAIELAGPAGRA